jgi:2-polyprenyl-3-methyl-5-hydroxy-6-metoxy-1,4-benzoquinol methylase
MTLGITDRLDVLDLGCGDGTTAVPAAKLGANVLLALRLQKGSSVP